MKTTMTAAVTVLAMLLTACGGDNDTETATTTTETAAPEEPSTAEESATTETAPPDDTTQTTTQAAPPDDVTTTTAPPTLSQAEQDQQDATQAVIDYLALANQVYSGESPAREFTDATWTPLRTEVIRLANAYKGGDWTQVGESKFEPDRAEPGDEEDTYEVSGCLDMSEVDVLDSTGERPEGYLPSPNPRREFRYIVLQWEGDWYVSQTTPLESTC